MAIEENELEKEVEIDELEGIKEEFGHIKESVKGADDEKRKKEDLDRQEKKEKEKFLRSFEKRVELGRTKIDLEKLKMLVEKGVISQSNLDTILKEEIIITADIEEIFSKIDDIAELEKIDEYLPIELRITKEEYINALKYTDARVSAISKLDNALLHLYNVAHPNQVDLDLFSSVYTIFDKNLKLIQENTIDIKDSLEEDFEEGAKEEHRGNLWDKMTSFFK